MKNIAVFILFLTLIGLLDAGYLVWEHYTGAGPACLILKGCDAVLTSEYAAMFGLPVSLWGMIYYTAILFLTLFSFLEKSRRALGLTAIIVFAGFLFSAYFLYLQFFILKAICFYCLISAGVTFFLLISLLFAFRRFDYNFQKVALSR
ncbi:MAG: vitamin K epoxide reductase family protein [Candidatus Niyogibacteria bacterium]|nr:vitamin K epoxide reductase family protein [Candidatus Niyogibacteria bacterium]